MGKITYNEADFAKSADQFEKELLAVPVVTLREATKNITIKKGVRGTVYIGTKETKGVRSLLTNAIARLTLISISTIAR